MSSRLYSIGCAPGASRPRAQPAERERVTRGSRPAGANLPASPPRAPRPARGSARRAPRSRGRRRSWRRRARAGRPRRAARRRRPRATASARSVAAAQLDPGAAAGSRSRCEPLGGLADQVAGDAALGDRLAPAPSKSLALQRAAEDRAHAAVERAQRRRRRRRRWSPSSR